MRRPGPVGLPLALVLVALLAGCAGGGRADVRDGVEAVTAAANARDAEGVRDAVDDLLALLDRQVSAGELTSPEAARIAAAARQVRDSAALVDDKVIEAEREAQEEAAREAQEEADRQAREEAARQAEEDARQAEEDARKAAEELEKAQEEARKKAEEEAQKAEEDAQGEGKGEGKGKDGDGDDDG